MKFLELFDQIENFIHTKKPDVVVLNISLPLFGRIIKEEAFQDNLLARILSLSRNCPIAIPSFSFLPKKDRLFLLHETRPTLGLLNKLAFKCFQSNYVSQDLQVFRTSSAIHSFIVFGDYSWIKNDRRNISFGFNSLWDDLIANKTYWFEVGTHPSSSYSFLHQCEFLSEVPYRENINFQVKWSLNSNTVAETINYEYYAKTEENVIQNFGNARQLECFRKLNVFSSSHAIAAYNLSSIVDETVDLMSIDKYLLVTHHLT